MVLWIGVDDTDSLRGMCTTFLATELVRNLRTDLDIIGHPRLVRLNPNIPWKTRGNGAIALAVGRGVGEPFVIGRIDGRVVRAYRSGRPFGQPKDLIGRLSAVVETWSELDCKGTDPGLVVLRRKPSVALYWRAVRGIVSHRDALRYVRGLGVVRGWNSGRGIIGASAACAWRPRDRTWEVLAYRNRARWGTLRVLSAASVRRMDRAFPSTFNNYDYENRRVVIAPSSPCPVLFGIRGDRPGELPYALQIVNGERPDRWLVFETNQGTDDHVSPRETTIPRSAARSRGWVTRPPRTIAGGHVVFGLNSHDVTAYEPSKQFRRIVRGLAVGDRIEVIGSLRASPRTINLEKLHVVDLVAVRAKIGNPVCSGCGHQMKSAGSSGPYRCRLCHMRAPRSAAVVVAVPRTLHTGWYEPPVGSRRHLSKPLKRGLPA